MYEDSVIWPAHLAVPSNALAGCQRQRAVAPWLVRNLPLLPAHPAHWPHFGTNPIFSTGAHRSPRNFLAKAYYAQLQSVFSNEESFGLDLSCAEFVKGGFLRAVDLTRPRRAHNSVAWHKVRQGSLRLDVSFAEHIAANVSVFAMLEYPTRVQIFKDR